MILGDSNVSSSSSSSSFSSSSERFVVSESFFIVRSGHVGTTPRIISNCCRLLLAHFSFFWVAFIGRAARVHWIVGKHRGRRGRGGGGGGGGGGGEDRSRKFMGRSRWMDSLSLGNCRDVNCPSMVTVLQNGNGIDKSLLSSEARLREGGKNVDT